MNQSQPYSDRPPRMGVSSTRNAISRSKSRCGPCVAHAGMRKVGSLCCAVRVRLSRIGGRPRMCPGCAQGAPGGPGCGQHVPRVRPRCAQGAPGCVRDAPRMCPGCPRVPRMRPACAQGAPRVRPVCPRVPRMRPSCAHGGPACPGCVHHPCAGCAQGAQDASSMMRQTCAQGAQDASMHPGCVQDVAISPGCVQDAPRCPGCIQHAGARGQTARADTSNDFVSQTSCSCRETLFPMLWVGGWEWAGHAMCE